MIFGLGAPYLVSGDQITSTLTIDSGLPWMKNREPVQGGRTFLGEPLMELHQVRYLLAVCQTLNFTRAAEECHVSQPALSRAIQQLEAELGGELFRRERRLTHITDFGQTVLPALRQCVGFPGLEVKVFRGPPSEIGEKLKNGDAELAIAGPLGDDWDRFEGRKLFEEQFGVLLTRHHPLSQLSAIELPALLNERLLCRPHCGMTDRLTAQLQSLGARKITKHEVPLIDDLAGLVRANFGVGILPMGRRIPDDLSIREVEDVDLRRWIHVFTVAGRRHSIGTATLIRLLRAKDWSQISWPENRAMERLQ